MNASGGIDGELLPLVAASARFNDSFNSFDLRLSKSFTVGQLRLDALVEMFNLFNVTNVPGHVDDELLRFRQRARSRFQRSVESRLSALLAVRHASSDRGGSVRVWRAVRASARRARDTLTGARE